MLGIVGGMGPQAGLCLYQQVLAQTPARRDQDHVPTLLWSTPHQIPDRSDYLLGKEEFNPAHPVADIVLRMEQLGVSVVGIPCNTFHAPPIWEQFLHNLLLNSSNVRVVNLIEETTSAILADPGIKRIGLLGTLGTYRSKIYSRALQHKGIELVEPSESGKFQLHDAIYNPSYGIKALNFIGTKAGAIVSEVAQTLGTDQLVLGCTELCLDWEYSQNLLHPHYFSINPLEILAQAMVRAYEKESHQVALAF